MRNSINIKKTKLLTCILTAVSLGFTACMSSQNEVSENQTRQDNPVPKPYSSTYQPLPSSPVLIQNVTLLNGAGNKMLNASVLVVDHKIKAIGSGNGIKAGPAVQVLDAQGKWLTPGLIDVHSHLGVYSSPEISTSADGNEMSQPVTAHVWVEHSIWPQDPQFALALAGGVTSLQILPGSANLIGGRGVTVKNIPSRTVQGMKFPGAPYSLKMACGENPKDVYGKGHGSPQTRMANVAGYRSAWIEAENYRQSWEDYEKAIAKGEDTDKPKRNLGLETLVGVLKGEILVHNHCYRADEMVTMIEVAKEFNYKISTFHHAVAAYKIADILADNGICTATWADDWGSKHEVFDTVLENIALLEHAGACAIVHSDSARIIQHLNQEAAKAMTAGNQLGFNIDEAQAITWITLNAAQAMGIDKQTGSVEVGKNADLVLWDGNPFSIYSKAEKVYIDGALVYDRLDPAKQPVSDIILGMVSPLLPEAGESK